MRKKRLTVVLGADHAGYELKRGLLPVLQSRGFTTLDVGTRSARPVDYPDYAERVADEVLCGPHRRGILICGSGVGASIAANKIPGIRAGLCHDPYSAHQGVEDDEMNVLVIGSRVVASQLVDDLVWIFLQARFSGLERHIRRLRKISELEQRPLIRRESA